MLCGNKSVQYIRDFHLRSPRVAISVCATANMTGQGPTQLISVKTFQLLEYSVEWLRSTTQELRLIFSASLVITSAISGEDLTPQTEIELALKKKNVNFRLTK